MEKKGQGDDQHGDAAMDAVEDSPSAPLLPARPCSLLRYVLGACASCLLRLCGNPFSDRGGDDDADPAPAAAQEDQADGGGKTDEGSQIGHQLLARRRKHQPQRPGKPREGRGGGGGSIN